MSRRSGECASRGPVPLLSMVMGLALLLTACVQSGDTTPPTVTLNSSSSNVTSATTITLTATASDDVGVTMVEFYRQHLPPLLAPSQVWQRIGVDTVAPYRHELQVTSADNGTLNFRAYAHDGAGHSGISATVAVTVAIPGGPGNRPPRFVTEAITGAVVGVPYGYAVATFDPDAGDTLTITAPVLPGWLSLTDNGDGSALLAGTASNAEVGVHPLELEVSDGHGADASQAFTVTVSATNQPPDFTSTPLTLVAEDSPYLYAVAATDPDAGDTLTITAQILPGWLSLTDNGDGTAALAGTPGNDQVGDHPVELRVTDGFGAAATQAFRITVANTNDPPVARDDTLITDEDTLLVGNVLHDNGHGEDTDPDLPHGDSLGVALVAGVANGTLTLNADGSFNYLPTSGFSGADGFSYLLSDLAGQTDTAVVDISVVPVNDPPFFTSTPGDETVIRNTLTPNGVGVNFGVADPDGDPLTVTATSNNQSVVPDATLNPTCAAGSCSLGFTPSPDESADVLITLTVGDGMDAASTSFTVNVVPRVVINTNNGGFGSLRDAIQTSVPGDVIGFDVDGVFATPQTIGLLGQLVINTDLTIEGTANAGVTLDGQNTVRVLEVGSGVTVRVVDVRFVDGDPPNTCGSVGAVPCGGGVFVNSGSTVTLEHCRVSGGQADAGGGIFVDGATLRLRLSEVINNTAVYYGGGIANDDGTVVIEESVVSFNHASNVTAGAGGGVANINNASVALLSSLMESNSAGSNGGAIVNVGALAYVEISDSSLSLNSAGDAGGGIYNALGTVGLQNSVVSSNDAENGGGIHNLSGTINVIGQSSVKTNTAQFGGGIYSHLVSPNPPPTVTIDNSTVGGSGVGDGNTVSDMGGGIFTKDGSLVILNASSVSGNSGDDGGGIYIESGTVTLEDSGVSGNRANFGAGILNHAGTLTLTDSGVSANVGSGSGAGIYNGGGASLDLHGTTVGGRNLATGNRAEDNGGGIYNAGVLGLWDCSALVFNTADADLDGSGVGGGLYTTVSYTLDLSCPPDISGNVPDDIYP